MGSTTGWGLGEALKFPQCNKNISKALQRAGLEPDPLELVKQVRMDTIRSRAFYLSACFIKKLKIERAINLAVVLFACENCFFLLREEYRLAVFRIGVFRKKFELQRKEVKGR
jgi:hypothetical protein